MIKATIDEKTLILNLSPSEALTLAENLVRTANCSFTLGTYARYKIEVHADAGKKSHEALEIVFEMDARK